MRRQVGLGNINVATLSAAIEAAIRDGVHKGLQEVK